MAYGFSVIFGYPQVACLGIAIWWIETSLVRIPPMWNQSTWNILLVFFHTWIIPTEWITVSSVLPYTSFLFWIGKKSLSHPKFTDSGVPDLSRSFRKCRKETFRPFRPFGIQSLIAGWFKSRSRGFADEISVAGTDPRRWAEHGRGAQGVEGVSVKLGDFQEKNMAVTPFSRMLRNVLNQKEAWNFSYHHYLSGTILQAGGDSELKSADSAVDVFAQVLWSMVYAFGPPFFRVNFQVPKSSEIEIQELRRHRAPGQQTVNTEGLYYATIGFIKLW